MVASSVQPLIIRVKNRSITAGNQLVIPCDGCSFFRVKSLTTEILVRFNGGTPVRMSVGQSFRSPHNLETVTLINDSASSNIVDVFCADGDISDDAVIVDGPLNISKANGLTTMADIVLAPGVATQLFAVGATHRVRFMTANTNNIYPIRVAGSTADATSGLELKPGERLEIDSTAVIYAYNTAPFNQTVNLLRTIDS